MSSTTVTSESRKRRRILSGRNILRLESPLNHKDTNDDTGFNISTEAILEGIINLSSLSRGGGLETPIRDGERSPNEVLFSELGNQEEIEHQEEEQLNANDNVYEESEVLEKERASLLTQIKSMQEQVSMLENMVERGKRFNNQRQQPNPNALVESLLRDNDAAVSETYNEEKVSHEGSLEDSRLQDSLYPQAHNPQTIPRLQLFTGLEMIPVSTRAEMYNDDGRVITRHVIKAKSLRNKGNFRFTLTIDVDSDGSIVKFTITNLSKWAEPELESFIEKTTNANNISLVVCLYGLSGYAKLSWQRSLVFARLASEFPDLLVDKTSDNATIERDPISWIGDRFISFSDNESTIILTWDFNFDKITGQVQSIVSLIPSYSSKLLNLDDDGTLDYTLQAFSNLVDLRGVYLATFAILQAIFGDPK